MGAFYFIKWLKSIAFSGAFILSPQMNANKREPMLIVVSSTPVMLAHATLSGSIDSFADIAAKANCRQKVLLTTNVERTETYQPRRI
jgi:hypothetical protein